MKFFKIAISYSFFLICFCSTAFSAGPIHIAVMEDPIGVERTPFAPRVHVFAPSDKEIDEECQDHGVQVCSVLIGEGSQLPPPTTITTVPSLPQFSSYLTSVNTDDLVILNWSGSTGYPELPIKLVEELEGILKHFTSILEMDTTEFTRQVQDYIDAYEGILRQLPSDTSPLSSLLNYARTCLLTLAKSPTLQEEKRDGYIATLSQKIMDFKTFADEQSKTNFGQMKKDLLCALEKHPNTLIVWALGNEGECIDSDPFWQELLPDERILSHTLLVHGLDVDAQKHRDSNFTHTYAAHTLGKPYTARVWSNEESLYLLASGTSFSAPLVTIDAFLMAQDMWRKTGSPPLYTDVKQALLKK